MSKTPAGFYPVLGSERGLYESLPVRWANGGETAWQYQSEAYLDGQARRRLIVRQPWLSDPRETCYCCSCREHNSDPYCRNHGFAGTRRCDVHGTAGDEFETGEDLETPDPDRPLASVQAYRTAGYVYGAPR